MEDLYELFILGVLEGEQSSEISDHLSRECSECMANVQNSMGMMAALSSLIELQTPPPALKARVLSSVAPRKAIERRKSWPLAFALASAAALVLLIWGVGERNALNEATRQRNELRSALAILSESDTKTVSFGVAQTEPQGRVFISHNGGIVFVGNRLPRLANGKTFEFWLVPTKGNPRAAGLFGTNAEGVSVNVLAKSINPSEFMAVAVSIEPHGGSPQPTSKPILIVPLA
jgi:anti-sigma-K factor RskA